MLKVARGKWVKKENIILRLKENGSKYRLYILMSEDQLLFNSWCFCMISSAQLKSQLLVNWWYLFQHLGSERSRLVPPWRGGEGRRSHGPRWYEGQGGELDNISRWRWTLFWTSFDSLDRWLHMWEALQWKTSVHYCEEGRWVLKSNQHEFSIFPYVHYRSILIRLYWISYDLSPGIFSKKSEGTWNISLVAWIRNCMKSFLINTQNTNNALLVKAANRVLKCTKSRPK